MRSGTIVAAVAGWVVALMPSAASAVLQVNVDRIEVIPTINPRTVFFDLFVVDLDNQDERLTRFTITLDAPNFSETGLRFSPPPALPSAAHPFVFSDFPGTEIETVLSTATRLQVTASIPAEDGEVNVRPTRNGLFAVPIFLPSDPAPGFYPILIDRVEFTGRGEPIVGTRGFAGFIFIPEPIVPEPSAAAMLTASSLALLRRRRRPRSSFTRFS